MTSRAVPQAIAKIGGITASSQEGADAPKTSAQEVNAASAKYTPNAIKLHTVNAASLWAPNRTASSHLRDS